MHTADKPVMMHALLVAAAFVSMILAPAVICFRSQDDFGK